jgi:hypothetical protein
MLSNLKKREIEEIILKYTYPSKARLTVRSAGRDFTAPLRWFRPRSPILQLERNRIISDIDLLTKIEADDVEYRKRLQCFTQALKALITYLRTAKKKREIE